MKAPQPTNVLKFTFDLSSADKNLDGPLRIPANALQFRGNEIYDVFGNPREQGFHHAGDTIMASASFDEADLGIKGVTDDAHVNALNSALSAMAARLQASVNAIAQLSRLADGTSGNAADADRFADPLAGLQAAGVTAPDATMAVAALNAIDGLPFAQIAICLAELASERQLYHQDGPTTSPFGI